MENIKRAISLLLSFSVRKKKKKNKCRFALNPVIFLHITQRGFIPNKFCRTFPQGRRIQNITYMSSKGLACGSFRL